MPPTTTAHPALPAELVVQILEATQADARDARTLSSCSLVCKDWAAVAQRLLFKRVSLTTASALDGFVAAVNPSTPRGRMLSGAVHRLQCTLDAKQPTGIAQAAFAHAVSLCPRLAALDVSLYPSGDAQDKPDGFILDEQTLAVLRTGPRVAALHLNNWTNDAHVLPQLLDAYPELSSLSLSGTTPTLQTSTLPPCTLRSLRLNFQSSPSIEFTKWLLRGSSGTLRSLEFTRTPSCELFDYLLTEHCESLESLSLPTCASAEGTLGVVQCMRLRELYLENLWTSQGVVRPFPVSMERLAFAVSKNTPLQTVVDAISKSETLQSVTMHLWADGARHAQLADITMACALQGVELTIVDDIRDLRAQCVS